MKKILRTVAGVATAALMATTSMFAASGPSEKAGLGFETGAGQYSIKGLYAISEAFHIGTLFGFSSYSPKVGESSTYLTFAPYGRYLFGSNDFRPYAQMQFLVSSNRGNSGNALGGMFGAQYFVSKSFGVYGQINIFTIGLDDQGSEFGIGNAVLGGTTLGIEFYL